jgi:hypothetical protein
MGRRLGGRFGEVEMNRKNFVMKNRITAALTLISFLVFSWSCSSIREIKPEALAAAPDGRYGITKLETKSGEVVEYPDTFQPARVQQGQVVGAGRRTAVIELVEVDSAGLEVVSRAVDPFKTVKTADGRIIGAIRKIEKKGGKTVLQIIKPGHDEPASAKISLPEVERAWARRFDVIKTVLVFVVLPVAAYGVVVLLAFEGMKMIWKGAFK